MSLFTNEKINFKYPWRTYQERILAELNKHLEDKKLHIVAPPGSGKTVLGLEVVKRLNQPSLILAPTITIRNQWAERLTTDFLQGIPFEQLSLSIKTPNSLTISTYQGLHTTFKDNPEKVILDLQKAGIQNLVVDECHHLKNEWWKTLFQINEALNLCVIALTATPPFDVSGAEWQRYHQLCGEVDAEINVAELVADKNLCPHQDYIYFSLPTEAETNEISLFHNAVDDFIDSLKGNLTFRNWLKQHPFLLSPEANLERIYETPDYFSALLIVNEFLNGSVPLGTVEFLGGDIENLPKFNTDWLQLLLNQALFKDQYFLQFSKQETFKNIIRQLKRIRAIERKKIVLQEPDKINKKLRLSSSKLESITRIIEHEWQTLKDDLRAVILTDYIRKEEMPTSEFDIKMQQKIGVVPIFERLRKGFPIKVDLGILSGSLVVIPKFALPQFQQIIKNKNLKASQFSVNALPQTTDYLQIETSGELSTKIVEIITELFTQGGITVLIGTKSLLGEGWDAPAVNSLILATFVGSYVLSNQMRGRAIRTEKKNPNKTANIWHLICIDPKTTEGGHDFQILKRRFRAFHGVSFDKNPVISNGIKRFNLPTVAYDNQTINRLNSEMLNHADNRMKLKFDWQKGLENGMEMIEEIKLPILQQKGFRKIQSNITNTFITISKKEIERFNRNIWLIILLDLVFVFLTNEFLYSYIYLLTGMAIIAGIVGLVYNFQTYIKAFFLLKKQELRTQIINKFSIIKLLFSFVSIILIAVLIMNFFSSILMLSFLAFFVLLFVIIPKVPFLNRLKYHQYIDFYENSEEAEFIKNIGQAICNELIKCQYISELDQEKISVKVKKNSSGIFTSYLENASTFQNQLYLDALSEVLNPIENPRYLIRIDGDLLRTYDTPFYAAVPSIFSKRKVDAKSFADFWATEIASNKLIYTRTPDGRLELLKARGLTLNPALHPKTERVSTWR